MDRVTTRLLVAHLLSAGRAVLYPVYKGTHERNGGKPDYYRRLCVSGAPTQEFADYQRMIAQDARRAGREVWPPPEPGT